MPRKITKLSIKDIAPLLKWKDVKRAIKFHYPEDKNNYDKLFARLQTKIPKVRTKLGEFLQVYGGIDIKSEWWANPKWGGQKYLGDIKNGNECGYYGIHMKKEGDDTNWAISFLKWDYLANMPIHPDTLLHYTFEDIIAHFIWEITFYGSEKQMKKHGKELMRRVKNIKTGKAKTMPA